MPKAAAIPKSLVIAETKDPKKDFLLDIASQTFLEEGFAGASVGEIARRAHASKETFYSRYDSKNQLFEAVMRRLVDRFSSQLDEMMLLNDPPEKVLTAFAGKILERMVSDDGIALQKLVHMESKRFPGVARLFFELGPQRTLRSLGRYLDSQVAQERLCPLDGEIAAQHFMGILASDLMMRRSLGVLTKKPTVQENSRRIKTTVDVFLRAYGPVKGAPTARA
jgi:TetR/AcrR family transcriptional repressor of mexJK operon